jgi:benzoyl-CoA reductase/2-hydroxyglutaryl-CoA dehydratase subunit BcrC/BadD/HgdB
MRKASAIRSACEARISEELAGLESGRRAGIKVVGHACHAVPAAVIAGLGMRPVRVLCGVSADAESDGEKVVRPDVCPLVKTLLGNVREQRGIHGDVDIWIGLHTCDAMRRGFDVLAGQTGREVHPVQLPATRTPEAAAYFADQVRRIVADIEARHGVRFDPRRANVWQQEHDAAAAVLARAARSGTISPLDLHTMFHLLFIARPAGLAGYFEGLLAASPPYRGTKTLVLTGSPLAREDTVLLEELEARGYGVLPLNCTGLNAVETDAGQQTADDLIGTLALRSFFLPACARSRPNTGVYDRLAKTVAETGAAGVIMKSLKFCDHWYTERERMRRTLSVPVLVFDSDYAQGGRERLISRIDAFLEMMG